MPSKHFMFNITGHIQNHINTAELFGGANDDKLYLVIMADNNTTTSATYPYRQMKKKFPLKDQKIVGQVVSERKRKFEEDQTESGGE